MTERHHFSMSSFLRIVPNCYTGEASSMTQAIAANLSFFHCLLKDKKEMQEKNKEKIGDGMRLVVLIFYFEKHNLKKNPAKIKHA